MFVNKIKIFSKLKKNRNQFLDQTINLNSLCLPTNTGTEHAYTYIGPSLKNREMKLVKFSPWRRRDGRKGCFTHSAYLITVARCWRDVDPT